MGGIKMPSNPKRFPRSLLLPLLVGLTGILSGCSGKNVAEKALKTLEQMVSPESQESEEPHIINGIEYQNNNQFYADTVSRLLSCIDNGDKDGVKELLCNALKCSEDIDERLDNLVDGFSGDITDVTEYEKNVHAGSASYGVDYTSAFLNNQFYIFTDKQIYCASVSICPLDEKHEDGEDIVGIYSICFETLDYAVGDAETTDTGSVEAAGHACYIDAFYGDSTNYLPVQNGMNKDSIMVYRILPNAGEGGSYEEVLAWDNRDFESFEAAFGEPYAASTRNDNDVYFTDGYMYKLNDSYKYAAITVFRDTGKINSLCIIDISAYRNDEKDDVIFEPEGD
jgi:hypothetical protein